MSNGFSNMTIFPLAELPAPPSLRMTEEEYVQWVLNNEVKAEWVDGEVVLMSPANVTHSELRNWLLSVMRLYCEAKQCGRALDDMLVRLSRRRRFRIPDIFFVSQDRLQIIEPTMLRAPPEMVVEIVSPDSVARDWRDKYAEYEEFGIREYWVIDPQAQSFDIYMLDSQQKYQRLQVAGGVVHSAVIPGFWVRSEWFADATRPGALDALRELGVI